VVLDCGHSTTSRALVPDYSLPAMTRYYFDFRSGDVLSVDEEGRELPDADAAHTEAAVDVRDELSPVLEVSAVLVSKFLRKQ
jgi:hypothetical protein